MAPFSRRSFFGGLLGALGSLLGPKAAPTPVAPPAPAIPAVPRVDPLGSVTTYVYDARVPLSLGLGSVTTYAYDRTTGTYRVAPPTLGTFGEGAAEPPVG